MFLRFLIAFTAISLCVAPAFASEDTASAFRYADQKEWSDARIAAQNDPVLLKLITWRYLLDPDSGAGFDEITSFIKENPEWPEQKKLRLRAELSLRSSHTDSGDVIAWFGSDTPVSGMGKLALAEALQDQHAASSAKITGLLRDAWHSGDFDESTEKNFIAKYGDSIRAEDDIARIDRLLWEEKTAQAKRILNRVPLAYQKLYKARMALEAEKKLAIISLAQVDSKLKKDPGLQYDRMRYRSHRDDYAGVREILLATPASAPYPEKWWPYRELQARHAIDEGNYTLAEKLLANHGDLEDKEMADAKWLTGWLKLEFQKQPKEAYEAFTHMYETVHYPVSRARAAYWAARAAEKTGDAKEVDRWYNRATQWPTTFYGQLATLKMDGEASLAIPSEPHASDGENHELFKAVKLCVEADESELASKLIADIIESTNDEDEIIATAQLGKKLERPYLSVRGAKKAFQHNVVLINDSYPVLGPTDLPIERPLALGITRQESEFDADAHSPSGAIGMMQLLPGTAKETARKIGVDYSKEQLHDPDYNMTLGSHYLSRLIDGYSGSYVMAIAAYNAGPGNVRNWAAQFGTPGTDMNNAIDWIEKIPFVETRNYVERVLENLQVYRHITADGDAPKLRLGEDLVR